MSRAVGIDLGTTNSVIAVLENGVPTVVPNAEGALATPSVVAFDRDRLLVGEPARRFPDGPRKVSSVKRRMGTDWSVSVDGRRLTVQEVAARILAKLKRDAEAYLGEPVTRAVVTVPAHFSEVQRTATREAAEIAGIDVLRMVNEPTAAALAFGLERAGTNENVLVVDLGGGTLDMTLLDVDRDEDGFGVVRVVATVGDNRLGGDDWDERLVDHLVDGLRRRTGVDISRDPLAMARLRPAAESAKRQLSAVTSAQIFLPYIATAGGGPVDLDESITRAQFERLTADLLERLRQPFERLLRDAGITAADLSQVLLVGGSTRMPAVRALIRDLAGRKPSHGVNPDEVVALGAALQAGILTGERTDALLLDVVPLSLGLETKGGVMTKLVERNTALPTKRTEVFTTADDNQPSVLLQLYQGERELAKDNLRLGVFELTGIPPAPKGVPQIEVTFEVDANGLLHVSAKDLGTGKQQTVSVSGGGALPREEIDRMIRAAQAHAGEDREERRRAEARPAAAEPRLPVVDDTVRETTHVPPPPEPAAGAARVFISYRRDDLMHLSGRLYDALADRFGEDAIFMDVDRIPPGADFLQVITDSIRQSAVMLVLIGERWLDARDGDGRRRLDDPGDYVRVEIETALRERVHIIPVLADRSVMPHPRELPESIRVLAGRNAAPLRHESFRRDARDLLEALQQWVPAGWEPGTSA